MSGKDQRRRRRAIRAIEEHKRRNPWLIGALVRVIQAGFDKDKQGIIEDVVTEGESDVHTVTVRLRDGNVVKFLGNQLVLV